MALQPSDYEEIRQLLARYNFAVDFGHIDKWVDTFTPDGTFSCVGLPDGAPLGGKHQGQDALRSYAESHFEINQGRARHWNWNLVIDGEGDTATMQCYLNAFSAGQGDSAQFRATGVYRDRLLRTDEGWKFAEREVTIDPA
ncbi:MAG: nuclear transport factor 2 family protein [Actinomycetota bacterium]|nr:nuclear transport factor 2 family protein [Actinomycetota bacterium]MEC9058511.1 nuclear transport factor 2 family protein [Actinomycetota bacterium]|tara:strand:+ start:38 stop:460 length:423 start_codon:yes stop_codon:yes gene_type:complete